MSMSSILIKDTTKEERARIVAESLGDEYSTGCGFESTGIDYQLYIDGVKELRDLKTVDLKLHILRSLNQDLVEYRVNVRI